jgi:hypothetical protein
VSDGRITMPRGPSARVGKADHALSSGQCSPRRSSSTQPSGM